MVKLDDAGFFGTWLKRKHSTHTASSRVNGAELLIGTACVDVGIVCVLSLITHAGCANSEVCMCWCERMDGKCTW